METCDNIWMIQMPESEVSQYYVNKVLPSWKRHGFEVNMFDAVTVETLHLYDDIKIDQYHGKRDFTPSEMGCWYSHYLLWEKCVEEDRPITVIEHDTECLTSDMPVIAPYFSICNFQNDDEFHNYCDRFKGHPYWWDLKLCPITSAYYIEPEVAEELLLECVTEVHTRYIDDIMFDKLNRDTNLVTKYCRPVYDAEIGGTVGH